MKAHGWTCVLGLLCMPAEVILLNWTVSQEPQSIAHVSINSSAQITCSTSLPGPMGLYLHRRFHGGMDVVYLSLKNGLIIKNTTAPKFRDRLQVSPNQQKPGSAFTLSLHLLEPDDTDLYYCTWSHITQNHVKETLSSNGTIIIIREGVPAQELCNEFLDMILIFLSVTVFAMVLMLFIVALTLRSKQFRHNFRPARSAKPPGHGSPQHICRQHRPQHRIEHCAYMVTSVETLDFRGIL